jgi:four helix bundle protein
VKSQFLQEKSYVLALRIIKLAQFLQNEINEYILSKQILRSGTSIGALLREAKYAESKAGFLHKQQVALKEANETEYWLLLLKESNYITSKMFDSIHPQVDEILKLLISSTKTLKSKK